MDHVKDLFVQLLAAILVWKAPALGVPVSDNLSHELALFVVGLIGKLQKSPIPSLAPATETTVKTIVTKPPPPVS